MKLYLQNPTLEDLQQRFGHKAEEYYQIYQQFETKMRHYAQTYLSKLQTQQLPATQSFITQLKQIKINRLSLQELGALTMQIMEHNRTQSYVDFVHCARLGFHYSQKLINNFQQRFNISEEKAKRIYSTLNQGLEESQITKVNLEIDQAKTFKQALKIAKEKIGHYSTGEMLEIHHPAMRDCPELLINYVQGIRQSKNYSQNFEQQKQNRKSLQTKIISKFNQDKEKNQWQEIITFSQTYMALRETAKYYFCQEYLVLKDALEEIGRRTNLDKGEIYHLYPKEIISYIKKPTAMKHLITSRKQARENYRFLDMPPTIREQDIKNLSLKSEMVTNFTSLHGKFLANGETLTGVVVNIDELIQTQTIHQIITKYHQEGKKVILVANQMNLTHDPLIANADALIIKNAGLVAHGAQRARELGKGAIGGIETKVLPTGTTLIFNPKRAIIKKIK
jgi:phosphohistidine swiveling domain-containing protein